MRSVTWRLTEWYLARHLTRPQVDAALGDLAEDFAARQRTQGQRRAALWLVREAASLVTAYRSRIARDHWYSRRTIMGETWVADARLAIKRLRKRPGGTLAAVFALGCSIAAAGVTSAVVSAVIVSPLPVESPERLMLVAQRYLNTDGRRPQTFLNRTFTTFLYPDFLAVRESGIFESVSGSGARRLLVVDPANAAHVERLIRFASHEYLSVLGIRVEFGRWFGPADDRRGAPLTAVLSHAYWRVALNSDPEVIGQTILVSGVHASVIGVMRPEFRGLNLSESPDLFLPLHSIAEVDTMSNPFFEADTRGSPASWIEIVGRLRSDAAADTTRSHLTQTVLAREAQTSAIELIPIVEAAVPESARLDMRQFVHFLSATVAVMLLVGAGTVGMLLLVRTESRRDELAICLALGGRRCHLARGVAVEATILALCGSALAVPVAAWLITGLTRFTLPGGIEAGRVVERLDATTMLVIAASGTTAALVLALVAGVLGLSSSTPTAARIHPGGTRRITSRHARTVFVAAQVGLSLVLLTGATLLVRSLVTALNINPELDSQRLLTATVVLGPHGYSGERARLFFDELLHRLEASPHIEAVAVIHRVSSMGAGGRIYVDRSPMTFPSETWLTAADDSFFAIAHGPVVEGRSLTRADAAGSPDVAVVSESLARAIAGNGSVVGKRIGGFALVPEEAEIVGVVPDVITSLADMQPLTIYYSPRQLQSVQGATVTARTSPDTAAAMQAIATAISDMDPRVSPTRMMTLEDQLRRQMGAQDLGAFVLGGLGAVATLLTLLGAYVVADSMSASRRREFTIRRALGASRAQLGAAVVTDSARLIGIGILAGLLLAWLGAGTIRAFLFRVEPLDPTVLLAVSGAILLIALLVSLRPAMESARVDVTSLLRDE
jgi:putative ABC transport system permease protein